MAPRRRVLAFGTAGALTVAGGIIGAFASGLAAQVVAIALLMAGLGGALLLIFLEVGLSEERQLAADEKRRRKRAPEHRDPRDRPRFRARPRRPG